MENSLDSAPGADCKIQEEKKELLEKEILQKLAMQETLTHLTIEEHSDVTKLADAIEPRSTYAKERSRKKLSLRRKWMIVLLIVVILFGWFGIAGGTEAIWICMMAKNIRRPLVMVLFNLLLMVFGIGTVKLVGHQEYITEVENYRKEWK